MSGGLPPWTAGVTFCSELSLLTYRLLTFGPGFCSSYSEISLENALASGPVYPSQIWIDAALLLLPPLPLPPLWLSVPQAVSTSAAAPSRLAVVTYSRCLAIPSHILRRSCSDPARSGQVLSNSDHAH